MVTFFFGGGLKVLVAPKFSSIYLLRPRLRNDVNNRDFFYLEVSAVFVLVFCSVIR